MHADYLIAWLLPLFVGSGIWWLANARWRFCGDIAASIGYGWLVGLLLCAACAQMLGRDDTVHALALVAPWLFGVGILAWIGAALRLRRRVASLPTADATPGVTSHAGVGWRALWWLLLVMIVLRFLVIGDEASLRPIFPWDAWASWAVKPKSWILLGHADAYVPMLDWLREPDAAIRTLASWSYPEWLAWIEVWFASGAGGWNEPLVDLAWCGALAAFAIAAYGYWRGFGLRAWVALALVYVLVSLPLIDAHVALAGYADLWVAVLLGLATLAWSRWLFFRERGQWLLGVMLALCLPAIKLEGAVWLLAFSAVVVLDLLPGRWRWRVAGAVVALVVIGLVFGGFGLPVLGLGWVHIAWGRVEIPTLAPFNLTWHAVDNAMLASLFTLPNWHLLWYVFPFVVALRWRVLLHSHAARVLGLFVLLQLMFLFVLFFFTSAAAWAEDYTSANRLILQIVPTLLVFVAVLLRDARPVPSGTTRAQRVPSARA